MAPMAASVGNNTAPTTPNVKWDLDQGLSLFVLDGDAADVSLPYQFLDRRDNFGDIIPISYVASALEIISSIGMPVR